MEEEEEEEEEERERGGGVKRGRKNIVVSTVWASGRH